MRDQFSTPSMRVVCRGCLEDRGPGDRYCRQCGAGPDDAVTLSTELMPVAPTPQPVLSPWQPSRPAVGRQKVVFGAVIALLAVASIAGATLSVVNYRRATTWENRADEWEARATAADQRAADLDAELTETKDLSALRLIALEDSESHRADLQVRIDELAGEKASAEDQQRIAEGERDSALYVSGLAGTAAIDARQCLADVNAALDAIIYSYSVSYIDSLINVAIASCDASDRSYASFAAAVGY